MEGAAMAKSAKNRPGQIGDYWLSKRPARNSQKDAWCRTWFDPATRQTSRASLGAADFHEASLLLADWVLNNVRPDKAAPEQVLIDNILLGYWNNHAKNLPSAKAQWNGLAYWYEYWTGQTVAEITPNGQRLFREWLANKGSSDGGIDRILSVGRAALNRARKWQELREAPHIFAVQTAIMKRSRTPMGRPIVVTELAKMMDAARSRHMLIYLLVASNTLARPSAVLDLRRLQFDAGHKLIDLNPPGRLQNKKYRPIVPASSTLLPWLNSVETPQAYYVAYKRKAIKSIKQMWYITRDAAGLDSGLTPYSIRHGMARELRKRRVPTEQISLFLGHLPKGSDATTSIYAPYEPDFCAEAVVAIDSIMDDVRNQLKHADIDQPVLDAAAIAVQPRFEHDTGVGLSKRDEVRFLILSGLPHREVVLRAGVSDGTVSAIRQQLKAERPIYRASESASCVSFACAETDDKQSSTAQPIEKIGGPGRIRTCDQAVMSGRL